MSEMDALRAANVQLTEAIQKLKQEIESASIIRPIKEDNSDEIIARLTAERDALKAEIRELHKLIDSLNHAPRLERLRTIDKEVRVDNVVAEKLGI